MYVLFSIIIIGFIEMMSAYFPKFSNIESTKICTWIFEVENELSNLKKNDASQNLSLK